MKVSHLSFYVDIGKRGLKDFLIDSIAIEVHIRLRNCGPSTISRFEI